MQRRDQHPEVLHARAELEYSAQYALEDPTYADTSLATLATLRARWPDHVSGYRRPRNSSTGPTSRRRRFL